MAGRGPAPKPSNLRQRKNKKSGAANMSVVPPVAGATSDIPEIPNPDGREWHRLTEASWNRAWSSPMAALWIETDADALGRLAILWDEFYKQPDSKCMAEIRLQEQRFGLSPLDRSRLQWEFARGEESETRREKRQMSPKRTGTADPRRGLMMVKR